MITTERLRVVGYDLYKLAYPEIGEFLDRAKRGSAVVLLPVGTMQPHGPHTPVGTDLLISLHMCKDACDELAKQGRLAAMLPPLPYGATTYFNDFPGCFGLSPETLTRCIVDVASELKRHGVRHMMVVNNNYQPEHLRAIYRALAITKDDLDMNVHYMDITHPHKKRSAQLPQAYHPNDFHASRYETSLVLAKDPDLVHEKVRKTLRPVPVNLVEKVKTGFTSSAEIGVDQAYIGSPTEASPEEGVDAYANLRDMLLAAIENMLQEQEMPPPGWYARAAAK